MKNRKNRLFGELKESMISKKAMLITKGGTATNDTGPSGPDCKIGGELVRDPR